MNKTLLNPFQKEEFIYHYKNVRPDTSDEEIESDFKDLMTPLPKISYKDYFSFLRKMKETVVFQHTREEEQYKANVILNKLLSTNCLYKKAYFMANALFVKAGIMLWTDNVDPEWVVFIESSQYNTEHQIKRTIMKLYAEYEFIPIILSPEAKEIYDGYIKEEKK